MRRSGLLAVGSAVLVAFGLGAALHPLRHASAPPATAVAQVRAELASRYYRPLPRAVLAQPRVDGMIAALHDPYTRYLSPSELVLARQATREGYSGVGLTLYRGDGTLLVTRTQPGPAQLAGIRPGDEILSVDGRAVAALPYADALARIVGAPGSRVALRVRRDHHTFALELVRTRFVRPSVTARLLPSGVGVVRVDRFCAHTGVHAAAAVRRLDAAGAHGLVLDLRGNPGGLLREGVAVSSLFLEEGATIVSLHGTHRPDRLLVARDGYKTRLPLVVLVDRASASAAEVVAGALRDHGRATVVGERTFGKSLVQQIDLLPSGGALKLTVAAYRTPGGLDISHGGVRPDVPTARPLAAALRILRVVT